MNRKLVGALALAAAVVLVWPTVSSAQLFRGGGWRGGGWWGGSRSGFYYNDGYYPYRDGYRPLFYRGYRYSPSWYDYGYSYDTGPRNYTYGTPTYNYQSAYPSESTSGMTPAVQGTRVLATIRLPGADAQLWIEGKEMGAGGLARSFVSPPLEQGTYTYTFRAKWTENGKQMDQTREVKVRPGDRIAVDFTRSERRGETRRSGYGQGGEEIAPPVPEPRRNDGAKPLPERRDKPDLERDQKLPPPPSSPNT
ncbi:MAG TPA: TIGR03000 domain-containing protein [Candidatus Solibacter sp.]|nr:TIGR03000 domain-containing protein [Candidatus Solibacter sp.]